MERAEAPITDHLRDFVLDLEKYKVVYCFIYLFPCRKIEIWRVAILMVILIL